MGNRLTGLKNSTYSYDAANELVSTTSANASYQYDKLGRLVSKTDATGQWSYTYDYENRLTVAAQTGATGTIVVSFKYDPFGRRINKRSDTTISGVTTTVTYDYVYDGGDIAIERETNVVNGTPVITIKRYTHGPGTDEHLAIENGGKVYYFHADGLGSITSVTDSKQDVVESYQYDSFGNFKRKGGKAGAPYAFTGREFDRETGLYCTSPCSADTPKS